MQWHSLFKTFNKASKDMYCVIRLGVKKNDSRRLMETERDWKRLKETELDWKRLKKTEKDWKRLKEPERDR